jgi:hypothetical protein
MAATKKASKPKSTKSSVRSPLPPYGIAIKEAIAGGNAPEMRKVATAARKHLSDVKGALAKLEKAIGKG